jgi:hypothetical protein
VYYTVLDLNDFESEVFAYFNTQKKSQGNTALKVRIFKNGDVAEVSLVLPNEDGVTQEHIDAMNPLLHHVYSQL